MTPPPSYQPVVFGRHRAPGWLVRHGEALMCSLVQSDDGRVMLDGAASWDPVFVGTDRTFPNFDDAKAYVDAALLLLATAVSADYGARGGAN
jgi:hypothetical protein